MTTGNGVIFEAEMLSKDMEESFKKHIEICYHAEAANLTGEERDNALRMQMDIFTDYLIGTAVAILSHYASMSEDYEEHVAHILRDKFDRIRTIHAFVEGKDEKTLSKTH